MLVLVLVLQVICQSPGGGKSGSLYGSEKQYLQCGGHHIGCAGGAAVQYCRLEQTSQAPANTEKLAEAQKILWLDPGDIGTRNLIYGQGGEEHQPPAGDFTFEKEDMNGSTPKFDVIDAKGEKWKLKLGDEARPETVATRLVWAVGFHTDEDYFLPAIHVKDMPKHIHRGRQFIEADGTMRNVRLERKIPGQKKLGDWKWQDGLFSGTREWNGLRVLMALINNWDLKDINNSIYEMSAKKGEISGKKAEDKSEAGELIYVVSDLGASFGPTHLDLGHGHDKGELKSTGAQPIFEERRGVCRFHCSRAPPAQS